MKMFSQDLKSTFVLWYCKRGLPPTVSKRKAWRDCIDHPLKICKYVNMLLHLGCFY